MPLPPWLDISPQSYMQAVQAGDVAGQAIARERNRVDETAFKNWMQEQELRQAAQRAMAQQQQQQAAQQALQDYRMREAATAEARQKSLADYQLKQISKPSFHTVGDVGYQFDPDKGTAVPITVPSIPKPQSTLGKLQADKALAKTRGDDESVNQYEAAIQELISNKGRSVYMGMDDQGKPIFQMTEGGGKALGPPTIGMQTYAQEHLAQYKNALQTIDMTKVTPEMVGARGMTGEWVVDRGLAQLTGQAEGTRVQGRTLLRLLREGVLKQVSDSSRYSAADRKEIEEIFPSSGWFESADRANKALAQVRQVFANRAKVFARSISQKAPIWSLSDSELKKEYPDKQEIADLMKRNIISKEEALSALVRGGY